MLITRAREQADATANMVLKAGATPVVYPTITVVAPPSWEPLDAALGRLGDHAWTIFSSPSAVAATLARAAEIGVPAAAFAATRIAAVGEVTAVGLRQAGLRVELVPAGDEQRQEGLLERLLAAGRLRPGARILFPQAMEGRELLREELVRRGFAVEVVPVSRTVERELSEPPPDFDAAMFGSPSALRAFVRGLGRPRLDAAVVAVIGKTTASAAAELGVRVDLRASAPSFATMIDELVEYLDRRK